MTDGSPEDVRRVSGEIDVLRRDLGSIVAELDRRRHEMLDVRLQARRHPVVVVIAAGGAALVVGGLVALAIRQSRERRRPTRRVREARRAIARLLDHPHRVAAEPSVAAKIATAAGVAAGSAIARQLATRMMARAAPTPR